MSVDNPLADNTPTDQEDQNLVARARSGDRRALEDLIQRHQGWMYNIALRMLYQSAGRGGRDARDPGQSDDAAVVVRGPEQFPHLALPDRRQSRAEYEARARRARVDGVCLLWRGARRHP